MSSQDQDAGTPWADAISEVLGTYAHEKAIETGVPLERAQELVHRESPPRGIEVWHVGDTNPRQAEHIVVFQTKLLPKRTTRGTVILTTRKALGTPKSETEEIQALEPTVVFRGPLSTPPEKIATALQEALTPDPLHPKSETRRKKRAKVIKRKKRLS